MKNRKREVFHGHWKKKKKRNLEFGGKRLMKSWFGRKIWILVKKILGGWYFGVETNSWKLPLTILPRFLGSVGCLISQTR